MRELYIYAVAMACSFLLRVMMFSLQIKFRFLVPENYVILER